MRTRAFTVGVAALGVVALLGTSACNPGPSDQGGGDKLTVARTGDIDLLDPARATAFQTVQTMGLVYDTLIDTDDSGKLVPGLAEKWDAKDPRKIVLTLRDGVTFHDGTKLTAADAKATLVRNLDKATASVTRSYLLNIEKIDASGQTLTLTMAQPDASLLTALTYTGNSILAAKDITGGKVGKEVNGTGPFRWQEWKQGQQLTLAGNAKYWNKAPKLKTVEFRVIPDEASIVNGMKAGSFHLGLVSDPAVAKQATGDKITLTDQATTSYHVLQLNAQRGPLQKMSVRQAIACAVDRQEVVDTVYFGKAQVTGPITSPAYDFSTTDGLPCKPGDLTKAKQLLAQDGYGKGFTLKTIVMIGEYNTSTNIAQVLQSQLAKIGVKLQLERQQTNVYVPNWKEGKFDAAVALNGGSTDPYLQYNRYFTSGGSLAVPAGFASEDLDKILRAANTVTDEAEREKIFKDLQKVLLIQSPWVWLFRNQMYYVTSKNVEGFKALPTESLEYLSRTSLS